jgi:ABC-2 type transport system permease protein
MRAESHSTATIAAVLWLAARIYRVGILMYGKKPTFPELLKWVRHS